MLTSKHIARWVAFVAAFVLLCAADAAWGCPSCKEALSSNAGGGDLVSGFFWSILFMLSMPFLLLGSFGLYFYLLIRRSRGSRAASE